MIEIGLRLKTERLRLNMKQSELANAGGVQANAQSMYERGKRTPSAAYIIRIATFDVDIFYVLTGKFSAAPDIKLYTDEDDFMAKYRCLPEHKRRLIADLVKCLSEQK
jgi:transcriptional regulator with XRE-family HTH domain